MEIQPIDPFQHARELFTKGMQLLNKTKETSHHGLMISQAEGVEYIQRAAESGLPEAQLQLGNMYASGDIVEQNDAEAATLYLLAASAGNTEAQVLLGSCYRDGKGIERLVHS